MKNIVEQYLFNLLICTVHTVILDAQIDSYYTG